MPSQCDPHAVPLTLEDGSVLQCQAGARHLHAVRPRFVKMHTNACAHAATRDPQGLGFTGQGFWRSVWLSRCSASRVLGTPCPAQPEPTFQLRSVDAHRLHPVCGTLLGNITLPYQARFRPSPPPHH
jgi:hypothetical protein